LTKSALGISCVAALVVACFGSILFRDEQFAFRDSAHYYYPLQDRVQQAWRAGHLPLWEPGENGGEPLLGSPTAAVLYPGKLIFAVVPFAWGVRLYTIAHVLMAFGSMVALMRSWNLSPTGSTIAGLAYAFGGPVLCDYFNIIYLVGAAWMPLAFRAADQWLRLGRRVAIVQLALILAMQVLGGDPEAAYLSMLCALGYAIGLFKPVRRVWIGSVTFGLIALAWLVAGPTLTSWIHDSTGMRGQLVLLALWTIAILGLLVKRSQTPRARLARMLAGLTGAGLFAAGLAAVQLFPTIENIASSMRLGGEGAIYRYDFSLFPCRLAEWIWPNLFGTVDAGNRFWMARIAPEDALRPWPMSLYMGALPLVLGLGAAGFKGGPPWRSWLTVVAIVSLWASLGDFAGARRWIGEGQSVVSGDDSLYGLLVATLPGLRLFRFPCKLLILTSLSLSGLAGYGWDRVASGERVRRKFAITLCFLVLTCCMAAASWPLSRWIQASAAVSHVIFGPLDGTGSTMAIRESLAHGALGLVTGLAAVAWCRKHPVIAGRFALLVLTLDLAWANARQVHTIPQSDFEKTPECVRTIRDAERRDPSPGPFRIHRLPSWVPIGWTESGSPSRIRELVNWEIDTVQPGFGLLHGVSYVLADESALVRSEYQEYFKPTFRRADERDAAMLGLEPGRRFLSQPRRALDVWGARYFILPSYPASWDADNRSYADLIDQTELIYPDPATLEGEAHKSDREAWLKTRDVQVRRNKNAFPRAWIVHQARVLQSEEIASPAARKALLSRLRARDEPGLFAPDLAKTAYIETDDPKSLGPFLRSLEPDPGESVTVRVHGPSRVVLEAQLRKPGIVVLADTHDPGWRLTIDGRPAPILRANLLMRAAGVEAGLHTLEFVYKPTSLKVGAWCSASALVFLPIVLVWARRDRDPREE
jgi:hypothetical protein